MSQATLLEKSAFKTEVAACYGAVSLTLLARKIFPDPDICHELSRRLHGTKPS